MHIILKLVISLGHTSNSSGFQQFLWAMGSYSQDSSNPSGLDQQSLWVPAIPLGQTSNSSELQQCLWAKPAIPLGYSSNSSGLNPSFFLIPAIPLGSSNPSGQKPAIPLSSSNPSELFSLKFGVHKQYFFGQKNSLFTMKTDFL